MRTNDKTKMMQRSVPTRDGNSENYDNLISKMFWGFLYLSIISIIILVRADKDKEKRVLKRVEQALQIGNRAGSGIGVALARFGDLPVAKVPWEIRLRRLLAKALSHHPVPSHKRPSRSWLAQDAFSRQRGENGPGFEPAILRKVERASLVVALDTSSSIDDATLDLFASEAISIIRRTGHETYLLGFDTEVHSHQRLNGLGDLNRVNLSRDGGTDFLPMLKEAEALAPSAIVVLTDLDAPTPNRSEIDIIWAVPAAPKSLPNCGTVLVMDDLTTLEN